MFILYMKTMQTIASGLKITNLVHIVVQLGMFLIHHLQP